MTKRGKRSVKGDILVCIGILKIHCENASRDELEAMNKQLRRKTVSELSELLSSLEQKYGQRWTGQKLEVN